MNDRVDANLLDCAAVIAAFGGIRPMARKLRVPVSTVQGWKQRNAIPENRATDILAAAETHKVDLTGIAEPAEPVGAAPAATTGTPPKLSSLPQKRSSSDRRALFVAVFALIVAVGIGGWLVLGAGVPSDAPPPRADFTGITDRIDALEAAARSNGADDTVGRQFLDEIANLRAEINRIAEVQPEPTASTVKFDELASRLQTAETEIDRIQAKAASEARNAKVASSAARSELENLREQISTLGQNTSVVGENVAGSVGLALAAGRLQRAIDNGDTYGEVLANARALSAGDTAVGAILDRLAVRAATGVPTRDALTQAFPKVARDIAAAANTEAASGWTDRTLRRIRNTVSIRRIGADVPGDTPGAKVARAEGKLNGGDLGGAITELDGLADATGASTWLNDARARHDAEVAASELEALAIASLQAGSGGS